MQMKKPFDNIFLKCKNANGFLPSSKQFMQQTTSLCSMFIRLHKQKVYDVKFKASTAHVILSLHRSVLRIKPNQSHSRYYLTLNLSNSDNTGFYSVGVICNTFLPRLVSKLTKTKLLASNTSQLHVLWSWANINNARYRKALLAVFQKKSKKEQATANSSKNKPDIL